MIANHFTDRDHFPLGENYIFPKKEIIVSIILSAICYIIVRFNFKFFTKKYFKAGVSANNVSLFIATSLLYIALAYIPFYLIVVQLGNIELDLFSLIVGLILTLLLWLIIIVFWFGGSIYEIYQKLKADRKLEVKVGRKKYLLDFKNISYAYMVNRILYIVSQDGTTINSDYSIQALFEELSDYHVYQANRNTIITKDSISNYSRIENGKIEVKLKPEFKNQQLEIIISRYKRKEFIDWISG